MRDERQTRRGERGGAVSPAHRTALWVLGILLVAAALRLTIWWVSPPVNAFDDHLEPIALYATQWSRPAPDACWQCYQPPLYYALSAGVLRLSHLLTGDFWTAWRSIQLLSVVFSLLQLAIAWRLLTLVGARGLAPRLCALAVLALLPRDIYTAVFVSNDAALGLAVSLAVLLYLEAIERGCDGRFALRLTALFAAACGAAWTKQSGLIAAILPVAFAIWWECERSRRSSEGGVERGRLVRVFAWLALGLAIVGADELYKFGATGHLLVSNQHFYDWPSVQKPGSVGATSFFDLRLIGLLRHPTFSTEMLDSFWTQLFARLWFDYEPKFLTDTGPVRAVAIASYCLGLVALLVWALGMALAVRRWRSAFERLVLVALQLAFLAVPLVQTLRFPYFSSMKATFFLPAVSVATIFVSLGFEEIWHRRRLRFLVLCFVALLGIAAVAQVVLIVQDIQNALLTSYRGGKLWRYPPPW
jgi:hypothetical protein